MKRISALLAMGLILVNSFALAGVSGDISGGGKTGEYTGTLCPAISSQMAKRGHTVNCPAGPGSGGNFVLVYEGKALGGLSQGDVGLLMMEDEKYQWYLQVGQIAPETPFMVASATGKVKSLNDVVDPAGILTIGVDGGNTSGSYIELTEIFTRAYPSLKTAIDNGTIRIKPLAGIAPQVAYNFLSTGQLDAVFFTMMPNPGNDRIKSVMESNGKFVFVPVTSPELLALKISDKQVYQEYDAPLTQEVITAGLKSRAGNVWAAIRGKETKKVDEEGPKTIKAIATMATIIVDPGQADPKFVQDLTEVSNMPGLLPDNSVAGKAKAWFSSAVEYAKSVGVAAKN